MISHSQIIKTLAQAIQLAQNIGASLRFSSRSRFILKVREHYSVPDDNVSNSKVVEDAYISLETTSVIDPTVIESCAPIFDEIHEFFECTNDDVDVQVESSTPIPTDVHTRDNDTSDTEPELRVDFTVTTLNYPLSNRPLELFSIIHWVVSDFSSFNGC